MNRISRSVSIFLITLATIGAPSSGSLGASPSYVAAESVIAGPAWGGHGAWQTKIQQVFDSASRTLLRRMYTVWNPEPSRNLDFAWTPDNLSADRPGRISGNGHLIWRIKDKPAYDRSAAIAEYQGTLRSGRIDGFGRYLDRGGLMYEGHWRSGLVDGQGTLKFPGGDEYLGHFHAGKANGTGRYVDVTGEIYEGPFVNGKRHGRGTTTLPNGRTYASLWVAGKESERSRFVRIAQSGGRNLPDSADDIRIGITVDRRLPSSSAVTESRQADLWYTASNTATAVQIGPDNRRLMSMWKGKGQLQLTWDEENEGPGTGVLGLSKAQLVPLDLRIEVQNRSAETVQIDGIYLDVQSSSSDTKPAVQIRLGTVGCQSVGYSPSVLVENFGWGAAERATVRVSLATSQADSRSAAFNVTKSLGDLDRKVRVDLEPDLKAAGVNTKYLKALENGFVCKSKSRKLCLQELRATGKFGTLTNSVNVQEDSFVLKMPSVLEYSWRDSKGSSHDWSHPFTATIPLGRFATEAECGEGGGPQIITTKTQQFKLEASGYRIPVAFQTSIQPGLTSPLILPVEAEKSSNHEFTVVAQIADGREIRSRPIDLTYYRPGWFAEEPTDTSSADDSGDGPATSTYLNHDFIGSDLRQIDNVEHYECETACESDSACHGYTHDKWNRTCFLKVVIESMRFDPQTDSGLKKGLNRPPELPDAKVIERYRNKAFPDEGYLIDMGASLEECEQRCADDEVCVAFTFKKDSRDCYLLNDASHFSSNTDADSGVKRQPGK